MKAKNDKEFHRLVCEREGYKCQACGKDFSSDFYFNENMINQYLTAHHLKTKKAHPELRLEVENGMCVDDECHKKIHSGKIKI